MNNLVLKNINKSFGPVTVIPKLDLEIKEREFCVFVGPSGCGKSTLLRMIAGLEDTTDGEIKLGSKDLTHLDPAKRGIAMVFQSYALYPHMTVEQNMGFGLKMSKTPKNEIDEKVSKAASILKIEQLLKRKPKELSGGQRQRVAIGRAIVRSPDVFLFDEPLSNLDAELRVSMRVEIARLHKQLNATMIYVTHDQVEAMTLADKIVILRGGIIEQVGKPLDLFNDPNNIFVAGFLGTPRMNFIPGKVTANEDLTEISLPGLSDSKISIKLDKAPAVGSSVTIGVRPQHILMDESLPFTFELSSEVAEHFGTSTYIYSKSSGDHSLTIELNGHHSIEAGNKFKAGFDMDHCLVFDSSEQRIR